MSKMVWNLVWKDRCQRWYGILYGKIGVKDGMESCMERSVSKDGMESCKELIDKEWVGSLRLYEDLVKRRSLNNHPQKSLCVI
jgi:hypothetical protein